MRCSWITHPLIERQDIARCPWSSHPFTERQHIARCPWITLLHLSPVTILQMTHSNFISNLRSVHYLHLLYSYSGSYHYYPLTIMAQGVLTSFHCPFVCQKPFSNAFYHGPEVAWKRVTVIYIHVYHCFSLLSYTMLDMDVNWAELMKDISLACMYPMMRPKALTYIF